MAMEYVARYVQKTALDAARIIAINEHSVSNRWTHRDSGQTRITTVKDMESRRDGRAGTDCDEGAATQG